MDKNGMAFQMNSSLYDETRSLANKILESEEYRFYLECRKKVEREGLSTQVDEFRQRAFELQCQGPDRYQQEVGNLRDHYSVILDRQIVQNYLDAEINFCRMMQLIQSILVENIDVNVNFWD